jgi:hypothetical protein
MNRRRGWRRMIGAGATVVALAALTPGVAQAATVETPQQGRMTHVQHARPQALQARPAPEAQTGGRERDQPRDRDWRDGHRDRDGRFAWGWPYRGTPAWGWYEPYAPPAPPAPIYVPGQWSWNGYTWVWQPGYWTY